MFENDDSLGMQHLETVRTCACNLYCCSLYEAAYAAITANAVLMSKQQMRYC